MIWLIKIENDNHLKSNNCNDFPCIVATDFHFREFSMKSYYFGIKMRLTCEAYKVSKEIAHKYKRLHVSNLLLFFFVRSAVLENAFSGPDL